MYKDHRFYKERLVSLTRKGIEGAEEIKQMKERMVKLREEKKKQHDKASELKTKISAYNEKINVITAPRDKLPKQIQ